jgi:hypothetical protein
MASRSSGGRSERLIMSFNLKNLRINLSLERARL